jgi:hypothetical protein
MIFFNFYKTRDVPSYDGPLWRDAAPPTHAVGLLASASSQRGSANERWTVIQNEGSDDEAVLA